MMKRISNIFSALSFTLACSRSAILKPVSYCSRLLSALLLAMLFVACSRQKEQSEKDGFCMVGAWQLVQEEWINGDVITEGFEHYKICYDDQTFLDLRCHPEDDDDYFCAVNGGQYFLQDSVYQQVGADWSGRLVNDTIMKVFYPNKTQTWKAYPGINATTMADLKEETQGIQYINEKGHPLMHFFSLAKKRAEAERKYYYAGAAVLILGILAAVGYALHSRRRRRHVERLLAQFKVERQWDTDEDKKQREANEIRFLQSDFYQQLHHKAEMDKAMKQSDWDELEAHVAKLAPDFQQKLTALHQLSLQELRVCLLLKIHLSPAEIATLTCKTQSAITLTRSRLYKKVFNKKGSAKDWDDFIIHNL